MSATTLCSVVVCTHNPREDYFARCLDGLRSQTLPKDRWELMVVDNRSEIPVSNRFEFTWHPRVRLIREEKPGLTPARLRGIREATGDLLIFVDDDNVLDPDYVETAVQVANEKLFLGSWSGQCRPAFEKEPPAWTKRYWGNLVIREFENDIWSNLPRLAASMPCGAGLCVRRSVAQHYELLHQNGSRKFQFDRNGTSLLSGGDNDLAATACKLELGVGLISSLKLTHLISPERLTEDYLARLAEGIHFSSTMLDHEYGIAVVERGWVGRLADQIRLLRLGQPHRRILKAAYRGQSRAAQMLAKVSNAN